MGGVVTQPCLHLLGRDSRAVRQLQAFALDPEGGGGAHEAGREVTIHAGEDTVPRGERVDDGRLPGPRTRIWVEHDVSPACLKDVLNPAQALLDQGRKLRAPDGR